MTTWFAPVGISSYTSRTDLAAIPAAVRDLWMYIERVFDAPEIIGGDRIDDGVWDLDRVEHVLGASLASVNETDVVIVYWAGHGFVEGEHRLALSQGEILTRRLADWLFALRSATVVCILDCCGASVGGEAIRDLADKLRRSEAPEARETRRIALIAAGRDEDTEEGLLVRAMLEVLHRGPDEGLSEEDRWTVADERIGAQQLVAAVNERMADQQALVVELRNRSVGRFFPSLWHLQSHGAHIRSVPPAYRQRIEAITMGACMEPPADWTEAGLRQTMRRIPAGCSEERRLMITERLEAVLLAMSAETMIESLVNTDEVRAETLRAARRAAIGSDRDPEGTPMFDLLVEASRQMVGNGWGRPVERVLRFAARLDHELNQGHSRRDHLFAWARGHGLSESAEINANIDRACSVSEAAVLIISLLNSPGTPIDAFPTSAESSLFIGPNLCAGSTRSVAIDPPDQLGLGVAIMSLVKQYRGQMTTIHLLVPDQLLLFDPAAVPIPLSRNRHGPTGRRYAVRVHCDRTDDHRLEDFHEYYRQILQQGFPEAHYDRRLALDELDDLWDPPPALIFRFPIAVEAKETLIDAILTSPIVVWPETEPGDRDEFIEVLGETWPDLPTAAHEARWRRGWDRGEHLARLRLSWDDADWIKLQKDYYARR